MSRSDSAASTVLVCGGSGYIGSHTIVELINSGYNVVVVDNEINSSQGSLNRVREITNCDANRIVYVKVDMCNKDQFETLVFQALNITFSACIHFAGLKVMTYFL